MSLKRLPFTSVFKDATSGNVKTLQSDYLTAGDLPIIDQGADLIGGYTNDLKRRCKAPLPTVIFGDHTRVIKYVDFPFAIGADGTKVLIPKLESHTKYLYHALIATPIEAAGYSRHFKFLKEKEIPLPPLEEQKRIAGILDAADALRQKRRQALASLDTFLQSTFLDLFGDPVTNPKGWEVVPLPKLTTKFLDGPFGSNLKTEHYQSEGYRVIRLQNIGVGEYVDNDKAYISKGHFNKLSKHRCEERDVLVGTLGDPNLRACLLPASVSPAINKADCIQIRANPKFSLPEYIVWLLNQKGTLALTAGMVLGQTRSRISMGRLKKLNIPLPPLDLQQRFADIVSRVEAQKARMRSQLAELDTLFASLQQRAFNGEL